MSCLNNSSDINQTFIIEPLAIDDIYTTGATLINSIIYFDRTDMLSAYTANLSSFVTVDTYVTGMTFSNNTITITRNDNVAISASINTLTGLTISGSLSATTFYGDGSQLTGISTGETYTNSASTPTTIGGIAAGSTFSSKTMTEMWNSLLYPYQTPVFTSFSRTNLSTDYDLGQSVLAGSQSFVWGTSNPSNIIANTIKIDQLFPSSVNILSGSTNDGTQTINLTGATISASSATTISMYRITATNTNSVNFTSTISRSWKNRWYYGKNINSSLTPAQITGLTNTALVTAITGTSVTFPSSVSPEYLYIVIPQILAQPSDWRDSTTGCFGNNIPYSNIGSTSITNTYGISTTYNVYRSTNPLTSTQNVWLCS